MLTTKLINRTIFSDTGQSGYCAEDNDCGKRQKCNNRNKCVLATAYRSKYRCDTDVHVVVVKTNGNAVSKCARKLRADNSMTSSIDRTLHTTEMANYEVASVGNCYTNRLKTEMRKLVAGRRSIYEDVKVILAVVSKNDLSDDCGSSLRILPDEIQHDFKCRDIRDMRDDLIVIEVNNESQCKNMLKLENKVRRAADLI